MYRMELARLYANNECVSPNSNLYLPSCARLESNAMNNFRNITFHIVLKTILVRLCFCPLQFGAPDGTFVTRDVIAYDIVDIL